MIIAKWQAIQIKTQAVAVQAVLIQICRLWTRNL